MPDIGLEMLYRLQASLPFHPDWSILEGRSLGWWPCDLLQVASVAEPRSEVGLQVCKLTISTRLLRDVELCPETLDVLAGLNRLACGSALTFDEAHRSIELNACFYVHADNLGWTVPLATFAGVAQMAEAQALVSSLGSLLRDSIRAGRRAVSAHPVHGMRTRSDDMQAARRWLGDGAAIASSP
jgi:hypothetical protein